MVQGSERDCGAGAGFGAGPGPGAGVALTTRKKLMLPTANSPARSMTTRQTCVPAIRFNPGFVTLVHCCQPPVSGMVIGPVRSTPSISMWKIPPAPLAATRISKS